MDIANADVELKYWGNFMRRYRSEYLGFSHRNVIHRIMKEGTGASQATAPILVDVPEDIASIDRVVLAMDDKIRLSIEQKYIYRNYDKSGAKYCRCSKSEYRNRIKQGVAYVAGALESVTSMVVNQ